MVGDLTVTHTRPDYPAVTNSIANLRPRQSTNVQAGLNEGVRLADQARRNRPDAYNYVILMSDGVANVDATDPFGILESAYDRDAANPLRLITIGVGIENYNDYLLEQLAQHGNGWYRYLDTVDQARATFSRDNWLALSTPFADQTRAQVTWDPSLVYSWRIVGYENRVTPDETFAQDRKEFAEVYSGAATTVLYELELRGDARLPHGENTDLGRVELRWIVPDTQQSRSQLADVTGRGDVAFGHAADPMLRLAAIVALAADRYSALPDAPADGHYAIRDDLEQAEPAPRRPAPRPRPPRRLPRLRLPARAYHPKRPGPPVPPLRLQQLGQQSPSLPQNNVTSRKNVTPAKAGEGT